MSDSFRVVLDLSNITQWADPSECQMTEVGFYHPKSDRPQIPEADALSYNKHVCVSSETLLSHTNCPWAHTRDKMLKKGIRWV